MRWLRLLPAAALAGCSPSLDVLGSYFPSWLLCVVAAGVATAVVRQLLMLAGLERHLLLPALTYLAMMAGGSMAIWLVAFAR